MHNFFLNQSSKIGNSILDWIRSIYFALLGSSILNFSLKLYTFDLITMTSYLAGNLLLLAGLIYSVKITKRFKDYDKTWPEDVPDSTNLPLDAYTRKQDKDYSWQHTLLYSVWLPALICIGIAGYMTERRTYFNNIQSSESVDKIKQNTEQLNRLPADVNQVRSEMQSLFNKINDLEAATIVIKNKLDENQPKKRKPTP